MTVYLIACRTLEVMLPQPLPQSLLPLSLLQSQPAPLRAAESPACRFYCSFGPAAVMAAAVSALTKPPPLAYLAKLAVYSSPSLRRPCRQHVVVHLLMRAQSKRM